MFPFDEFVTKPGVEVYHLYSFDISNLEVGWGKIPIFSEDQFSVGVGSYCRYDTAISGGVTSSMFRSKEVRNAIFSICAGLSYQGLAPKSEDHVFFFFKPTSMKLEISGSTFRYADGCKALIAPRDTILESPAYKKVLKRIKSKITLENPDCVSDTLALLSIMST